MDVGNEGPPLRRALRRRALSTDVPASLGLLGLWWSAVNEVVPALLGILLPRALRSSPGLPGQRGPQGVIGQEAFERAGDVVIIPGVDEERAARFGDLAHTAEIRGDDRRAAGDGLGDREPEPLVERGEQRAVGNGVGRSQEVIGQGPYGMNRASSYLQVVEGAGESLAVPG